MTEQELQNLICKLKQEDEISWIEAKHNLNDVVQIGKTISALSNSASWKNEEYSYIIWGLQDKTWKILGTNFDLKKETSFLYEKKKIKQIPKMWILSKTYHKVYFEDYEFEIEGNRLYVLKIKNCENIPVCFDKSPYIRIDSHNQELLKYPEIHKAILNKKQNYDWSAQICDGVTIDDLDKEAVLELKSILQREKPKRWQEKYKGLNIEELLQSLGLIEKKQNQVLVKNAGVLMLGKNSIFENDTRFSGFARIQWQYYVDTDVTQYGKTREQFFIPFLPEIKNIWQKIDSRNDPLADQNLYRSEEKQYEEITIRELLLNAIAHRDYENFGNRPFIEIIQDKNGITFKNSGLPPFKNLYELEVSKPKFYRNRVLADFLNKTGLVDQEGFGILDKVVDKQKEKGLPMPIFELKNNETWITLKTAVKNLNFAKKLLNRTDVSRKEAILLDLIMQGKNSIPNDIDYQVALEMQEKSLIEIKGRRYKKCEISDKIAEITDSKGRKHTRNKFTYTQEETEIITFLEKNQKGEVRKDFMQIFEYKNYTYDMTYNIIRRLKAKNKVYKNNKNEWFLKE